MMEADLDALLKTKCERVFPDVAPAGTVTPYVTWQVLGGEALRYGDNTAPDKRNALLQISVWSTRRLEATELVREIEDAICAAAVWQAKPLGEAAATYEPDTKLYGSIQRFDVWAAR